MNSIDLILILWLILSLVSGVKSGFVYVVGRALGLVFGFWAAVHWTSAISSWFGGGSGLTISVFLFLLVLVSRAVGGIVWGLNKVFNIVAIIPFLKTFNRVLGGVVSLLLAIVMASASLYIITTIPTSGSLPERINESSTAGTLLRLSNTYDHFLGEPVERINEEVEKIPEEELREDEEESAEEVITTTETE